MRECIPSVGSSLILHMIALFCFCIASDRSSPALPQAILVTLESLPERQSVSHERKKAVKPESTRASKIHPVLRARILTENIQERPELFDFQKREDNRESFVHNTDKAVTQREQSTSESVKQEAVAVGKTMDVPESVPVIENPQQRYLKEQFVYIRDLVARKLVYPAQARRMGWSGRTSVAFTIAEDGTVHDVRVAVSSGISMLDRAAADTVIKAAPFPRPPVRAEIVLPVSFTLM